MLKSLILLMIKRRILSISFLTSNPKILSNIIYVNSTLSEVGEKYPQ